MVNKEKRNIIGRYRPWLKTRRDLVRSIAEDFSIKELIKGLEKLLGFRTTVSIYFHDSSFEFMYHNDELTFGKIPGRRGDDAPLSLYTQIPIDREFLVSRGFTVKVLPKNKIPSYLRELYDYFLKIKGHYTPKYIEITRPYPTKENPDEVSYEGSFVVFNADDGYEPTEWERRISKINGELSELFKDNSFYRKLFKTLMEYKEKESCRNDYERALGLLKRLIILKEREGERGIGIQADRGIIFDGIENRIYLSFNVGSWNRKIGIVQYDFLK